ncbi:MAG: hypothetical protein GY861_28375 [bacterium]|nr:hypothetical protein [bacterium]
MITVLPFTKHNGIPTILDSEILKIYDRIIDEGSEYVFYDGAVNNRYDFLKMVQDPGTLFFEVKSKNENVAIVWINRIEYKQGRLHFCAFKNIWGKAIKIGREVTRQLLHKEHDGEYCFDVFWGFTPVDNQNALIALKRLGCKILDTIPHVIWDNELQKSKPGTMVYITREVLYENLQRN